MTVAGGDRGRPARRGRESRYGALVATGAVLLGAFASAACTRCSRSDADGTPAPSASALPAAVASGAPLDQKVVSSVVNPLGEAAYSGPTGSVAGRIVASGDPPLDEPEVLAKIGEGCALARDAYGKVFREGPERSLADVLVAVTGYKGYVPEKEPIERLEAKNCFWGTRTIALTFGQRIEVKSGDDETYIPELLGERGQAQLVATPKGTSVSPLFPTRPGRYVLIDNLKLFMTAEVIVLKYSTHDVTGLDGRFRIDGVPAGPAKLSAALFSTGASFDKPIVVEAGKTLEVDFALPFDADAHRRAVAALDAGAGSGTADGGVDSGAADAGAGDAGRATTGAGQ